MGSDLVLFPLPEFNQTAGFVEGGGPVFVEAFVKELTVEAFDESILGGFA